MKTRTDRINVLYARKAEYGDLVPAQSVVPGASGEALPHINLCDYWDYLDGIKAEALDAGLKGRIPPLRRLSVFITSACNLNCSYCTRDNRRLHSMEAEWLMANLETARRMGAIFLDVMGVGEPTLMDALPRIMLAASELGFVNTLGTNGATPNLATESYLQSILATAPLKIRVSLDSADPKIHNRLRGGQNTWEQAVNFIRKVVRFRETENRAVGLFVNRVVNADNFRSIPAELTFLADLGVDDVHLIPVRHQTEQFLTPEQIHLYNQEIAPRVCQTGKALEMAWVRKNAFIFGRSKGEIDRAGRGIYYTPTSASDCHMLKSQLVLDPRHRPFTCLWGKRAGGDPIETTGIQDEPIDKVRQRLMRVNYLTVNPAICRASCTREIVAANDWVQERLAASRPHART